MICIILVAGHGVVLEKEIMEDKTGVYSHLAGIPKALLPARLDNGESILDYWWNALKSRQKFSEVYLVTNADKYKYYERWASAHEFPLENIINDGSTTYENSLGAIADVDLAVRSRKIKDDIMVVAGDMLFSLNFDIGQVIDFFKLKYADTCIYYELMEDENTEKRGIIEVDQSSGKILKFLEKPKSFETPSRLASPVFYCFRKETIPLISTYTQLNIEKKERAFGKFMCWLITQTSLYGMKLPTRFQLIGQVGLNEYKKWITWFHNTQSQPLNAKDPLTCRSYARIGFIGNPSDGYYGKTISLSISNFWANVTIVESVKLKLSLHPLNDPTEFGSLLDLYGISRKEGYLGGLRLLQATCKKFYQYCAQHGIALARRNFTLKYDTNIPRQVGLAGSSAIITSTLKCLMRFYGLTDKDMPKPLQPNFILDVEMSELFIQAGLQDRVIQIYEGMVYMDFDKAVMEEKKHGIYEAMSITSLPPLWLVYLSDPSDSGKIHSNVKQRWVQGEKDVIDAMKHFADLTDQARIALNEKNFDKLSSLLNENFDTRLSIYGEAALGASNLEMITIARKYGSSAKFCGSGGAIFGICLDNAKKLEMAMEFQERGYVFCDLQPYDSNNQT